MPEYYSLALSKVMMSSCAFSAVVVCTFGAEGVGFSALTCAGSAVVVCSFDAEGAVVSAARSAAVGAGSTVGCCKFSTELFWSVELFAVSLLSEDKAVFCRVAVSFCLPLTVSPVSVVLSETLLFLRIIAVR